MEVESEDPLVVRMSGAEFADYYLEYCIRNFTVPADAARQELIGCRARLGQTLVALLNKRRREANKPPLTTKRPDHTVFDEVRRGTREEFLAELGRRGLTPGQFASGYLRSIFGDVADTDEIVHCRTASRTWEALCGREWLELRRAGKTLATRLLSMS